MNSKAHRDQEGKWIQTGLSRGRGRKPPKDYSWQTPTKIFTLDKLNNNFKLVWRAYLVSVTGSLTHHPCHVEAGTQAPRSEPESEVHLY